MPDKRLMRSRTEKMWAGVCGGLAEYFDVDPVLVRLVVVVLTLAAPPVGLVGYIVCMIVMPEAPLVAAPHVAATAAATSMAAGVHDAVRSGPAVTAAAGGGGDVIAGHAGVHPGMIGGLILVVVGTLLLMVNLDLFEWGLFRYLRWRYLWPSALIVVGAVMLLRAAKPGRS